MVEKSMRVGQHPGNVASEPEIVPKALGSHSAIRWFLGVVRRTAGRRALILLNTSSSKRYNDSGAAATQRYTTASNGAGEQPRSLRFNSPREARGTNTVRHCINCGVGVFAERYDRRRATKSVVGRRNLVPQVANRFGIHT
jgi:hypothetical protein